VLYLYLDESGDLGFDFVNKKPSQFFIITVLVVDGISQNRGLISAVKKTIKRKLNIRNTKKIHELKGKSINLLIKKYFYNQVKNVDFAVYSTSINKHELSKFIDQNRLYNFMTEIIVEQIINDYSVKSGVELIIDKSKNHSQIKIFNRCILNHLQSKIDLKLPINIEHQKSNENYGIQACDLFCYGIAQNYERQEREWLDIFRKKVNLDELINKKWRAL